PTDRVAPSSSVPAFDNVVPAPSVLPPDNSQTAEASTSTVVKSTKFVPMPESVPALAADASCNVLLPAPPSTIPEKTAPGSSTSKLLPAPNWSAVPLVPTIAPALVTVLSPVSAPPTATPIL